MLLPPQLAGPRYGSEAEAVGAEVMPWDVVGVQLMEPHQDLLLSRLLLVSTPLLIGFVQTDKLAQTKKDSLQVGVHPSASLEEVTREAAEVEL